MNFGSGSADFSTPRGRTASPPFALPTGVGAFAISARQALQSGDEGPLGILGVAARHRGESGRSSLALQRYYSFI